MGILDAQDVREAGEKEKNKFERVVEFDVETPLNLTMDPSKSKPEIQTATSRDSWKVDSDTLQDKSFDESPRSSTVLKHKDSSLQDFN